MANETGNTIYRVGIIGCGRIASTIEDETRDALSYSLLPYSHAGAYERSPRTQIVAVAETNIERLQAFGQRHGVSNLYADYREMLAREKLDIVSICTPTRGHQAVALEVARHPVKGIFLEKPIAQSLDEADEMIAAFHAAGIKVAVNHTRTFDPVWGKVRTIIQSGGIGTLRSIFAHWGEGISFGGTHLFDLLRSLIGDEAQWVFGTLEPGVHFDAGARGIIGFPNGLQVFVNCIENKGVTSELDIVGTEGRIRMGNNLYPEYWKTDRSGKRPMSVRLGFPGVTDGRSGMLRAVESLIGAIENGEKPASDEMDARADMEITVAFHLSAQKGGPVKLPLAETGYVVADPWGRDK